MSDILTPFTPEIEILDTTLRDGAQSDGISFSVRDKLDLVRALDDAGISIIEAGNPGAVPKDMEVFHALKNIRLKRARLAAFSATRRKNTAAEDDPLLAALVSCGAPLAVIFGKSSRAHAENVLGVSRAENLAMIADSIRFLRSRGLIVLYDAEHYFDAFAEDRDYALETVRTALRAGAAQIVLCDSKGGSLPSDISAVTAETIRQTGCPSVGIHCHNDMGLAVAGSMSAVEAGARHVQGTFLGFGERCGNTNLSTLIPNLQLKLGYAVVPEECLQRFTRVATLIADVSNKRLHRDLPYVGRCAFAHKAGMHVDAMLKYKGAYEHIDPSRVGNIRQLPVSEFAGRQTLVAKFPQFFPDCGKDSPELLRVLNTLKAKEAAGYQYEAAEGSLELLIRRELGQMRDFFELIDCKLIDQQPVRTGASASALVKIRVNGRNELAAAEGDGPVHAIDSALRTALNRFYPSLGRTHLTDYKVRVLTPESATAAKVRVLIISTDGETEWSTVGVSADIIEASYTALRDSIEIKLIHDAEQGALNCTQTV